MKLRSTLLSSSNVKTKTETRTREDWFIDSRCAGAKRGFEKEKEAARTPEVFASYIDRPLAFPSLEEECCGRNDKGIPTVEAREASDSLLFQHHSTRPGHRPWRTHLPKTSSTSSGFPDPVGPPVASNLGKTGTSPLLQSSSPLLSVEYSTQSMDAHERERFAHSSSTALSALGSSSSIRDERNASHSFPFWRESAPSTFPSAMHVGDPDGVGSSRANRRPDGTRQGRDEEAWYACDVGIDSDVDPRGRRGSAKAGPPPRLGPRRWLDDDVERGGGPVDTKKGVAGQYSPQEMGWQGSTPFFVSAPIQEEVHASMIDHWEWQKGEHKKTNHTTTDARREVPQQAVKCAFSPSSSSCAASSSCLSSPKASAFRFSGAGRSGTHTHEERKSLRRGSRTADEAEKKEEEGNVLKAQSCRTRYVTTPLPYRSPRHSDGRKASHLFSSPPSSTTVEDSSLMAPVDHVQPPPLRSLSSSFSSSSSSAWGISTHLVFEKKRPTLSPSAATKKGYFHHHYHRDPHAFSSRSPSEGQEGALLPTPSSMSSSSGWTGSTTTTTTAPTGPSPAPPPPPSTPRSDEEACDSEMECRSHTEIPEEKSESVSLPSAHEGVSATTEEAAHRRAKSNRRDPETEVGPPVWDMWNAPQQRHRPPFSIVTPHYHTTAVEENRNGGAGAAARPANDSRAAARTAPTNDSPTLQRDTANKKLSPFPLTRQAIREHSPFFSSFSSSSSSSSPPSPSTIVGIQVECIPQEGGGVMYTTTIYPSATEKKSEATHAERNGQGMEAAGVGTSPSSPPPFSLCASPLLAAPGSRSLSSPATSTMGVAGEEGPGSTGKEKWDGREGMSRTRKKTKKSQQNDTTAGVTMTRQVVQQGSRTTPRTDGRRRKDGDTRRVRRREKASTGPSFSHRRRSATTLAHQEEDEENETSPPSSTITTTTSSSSSSSFSSSSPCHGASDRSYPRTQTTRAHRDGPSSSSSSATLSSRACGVTDQRETPQKTEQASGTPLFFSPSAASTLSSHVAEEEEWEEERGEGHSPHHTRPSATRRPHRSRWNGRREVAASLSSTSTSYTASADAFLSSTPLVSRRASTSPRAFHSPRYHRAAPSLPHWTHSKRRKTTRRGGPPKTDGRPSHALSASSFSSSFSSPDVSVSNERERKGLSVDTTTRRRRSRKSTARDGPSSERTSSGRSPKETRHAFSSRPRHRRDHQRDHQREPPQTTEERSHTKGAPQSPLPRHRRLPSSPTEEANGMTVASRTETASSTTPPHSQTYASVTSEVKSAMVFTALPTRLSWPSLASPLPSLQWRAFSTATQEAAHRLLHSPPASGTPRWRDQPREEKGQEEGGVGGAGGVCHADPKRKGGCPSSSQTALDPSSIRPPSLRHPKHHDHRRGVHHRHRSSSHPPPSSTRRRRNVVPPHHHTAHRRKAGGRSFASHPHTPRERHHSHTTTTSTSSSRSSRSRRSSRSSTASSKGSSGAREAGSHTLLHSASSPLPKEEQQETIPMDGTLSTRRIPPSPPPFSSSPAAVPLTPFATTASTMNFCPPIFSSLSPSMASPAGDLPPHRTDANRHHPFVSHLAMHVPTLADARMPSPTRSGMNNTMSPSRTMKDPSTLISEMMQGIPAGSTSGKRRSQDTSRTTPMETEETYAKERPNGGSSTTRVPPPLLSAIECVPCKKAKAKKTNHQQKSSKAHTDSSPHSSAVGRGQNSKASGEEKGEPAASPRGGWSVTMRKPEGSRTFSEKREEESRRSAAPFLNGLSSSFSAVKDSLREVSSCNVSEGRIHSFGLGSSPIFLPNSSSTAFGKDTELAYHGAGEENATPASSAMEGVSGGGEEDKVPSRTNSPFSGATPLLPHSITQFNESLTAIAQPEFSPGMQKRSFRSGKFFPFTEGNASVLPSPAPLLVRSTPRSMDKSLLSLGPPTPHPGSTSASVKRFPLLVPTMLPCEPASRLLLTAVNNVAMKREVPPPDIPPEVIVAFDEYIKGKTTMWEFRERGIPHSRKCEVKFINMYEVQDELIPDIAFGWGKSSTGVEYGRTGTFAKGEYFLLSDLVEVCAKGKKHPYVQRFRIPIERKIAKRRKKEEKNMLKWHKKKMADTKQKEGGKAMGMQRSSRLFSVESEKRLTPSLYSHARDEECLLEYSSLFGTHTLKDDCMFYLTFQKNEEFDTTDDEVGKTDVVLKAPNVVLYLSWLVFMDFISSIGYEDSE